MQRLPQIAQDDIRIGGVKGQSRGGTDHSAHQCVTIEDRCGGRTGTGTSNAAEEDSVWICKIDDLRAEHASFTFAREYCLQACKSLTRSHHRRSNRKVRAPHLGAAVRAIKYGLSICWRVALFIKVIHPIGKIKWPFDSYNGAEVTTKCQALWIVTITCIMPASKLPHTPCKTCCCKCCNDRPKWSLQGFTPCRCHRVWVQRHASSLHNLQLRASVA